jgi:tripartite-type tricarboxylate transporter receptor subunit TctC
MRPALFAASQHRRARGADAAGEQGVADFDLLAWFMLYAPAATPPPVLARLREAAKWAEAVKQSGAQID